MNTDDSAGKSSPATVIKKLVMNKNGVSPYRTIPNGIRKAGEVLEPKTHYVLLLLWLLPDDWHFSLAGFTKIYPKLPESTLSRKILFLEDNGYLSRVQIKKDGYKMAGQTLYLWEDPEEGKKFNEKEKVGQERKWGKVRRNHADDFVKDN